LVRYALYYTKELKDQKYRTKISQFNINFI
jgi:hypothetical protein